MTTRGRLLANDDQISSLKPGQQNRPRNLRFAEQAAPTGFVYWNDPAAKGMNWRLCLEEILLDL